MLLTTEQVKLTQSEHNQWSLQSFVTFALAPAATLILSIEIDLEGRESLLYTSQAVGSVEENFLDDLEHEQIVKVDGEQAGLPPVSDSVYATFFKELRLRWDMVKMIATPSRISR